AVYVRKLTAGATHRRRRSPRDPAPGEAVTVELDAGPRVPTGEAWLELDGEGRQPLELASVDWDTLVWGYVRRFRGTIPGRSAGSPALGTLADFDRLVADAHGRGIRVLLDFVPNHWSREHPTFVEAAADRASPYVDWYRFKRWPNSYESFFGHKPMPRINYANAEARRHVLDAVRFWVERGADGYRVDYALGPDEDFWADFRVATAGVWTFGEVVETPATQLAFEGLLDGCLDFGLLEALRATFAHGAWDGARFTSFLDAHEQYFPVSFSRPSFLDNHDMNRFLWSAGGDVARLKLAALCQFTLAGPPIVYYGTEVGLSQDEDIRAGGLGGDRHARLPMLWGAD